MSESGRRQRLCTTLPLTQHLRVLCEDVGRRGGGKVWQVQRAGQAHPDVVVAESPPTPMSEFESGATSSPAAAALVAWLSEPAAAAVEAALPLPPSLSL